MVRAMRALRRLYGVMGLAGAAGFLTFLHTYLRMPGDGPADIGVAFVALVLMFAHAVPAAGLAAAVLTRWPTPRARQALWGAGLVVPMIWTVVGLGSWEDDLLMLAIRCGMALTTMLPICAVVAVIAGRLVALRRAWVVTWTVASALVLAADALVAWVIL